MNDGSWIETGDRLAILHFNRECFTHLSAKPQDYLRNALRFRKLLRASFQQLAQDLNAHEKFAKVKAFHGVSWIPAHGEKLGFLIEQLPGSLLNQLRKVYFRILLKTFFPHIAITEKNPLQLHAYWLTRNNLLKNFAAEPSNEFLISQQNNAGVARL